MKKISIAVLASILFAINTNAQTIDLEEKNVVTENGFEYSYVISNEQVKSVKGEDYSRYEITFLITNKTGCTKLYTNNERSIVSSSDGKKLAYFNCLNATGKRLTNTRASVDAKEINIRTKVKIDDKEETKTVKIGYIFRNGETIRNSNVVFILPLNEKPKINCSINQLEEL